ncbi:hypothetical protein CBL_20143 [Carabus blaptoides fortunei]
MPERMRQIPPRTHSGHRLLPPRLHRLFTRIFKLRARAHSLDRNTPRPNELYPSARKPPNLWLPRAKTGSDRSPEPRDKLTPKTPPYPPRFAMSTSTISAPRQPGCDHQNPFPPGHHSGRCSTRRANSPQCGILGSADSTLFAERRANRPTHSTLRDLAPAPPLVPTSTAIPLANRIQQLFGPSTPPAPKRLATATPPRQGKTVPAHMGNVK